jgi:hypothetical protein
MPPDIGTHQLHSRAAAETRYRALRGLAHQAAMLDLEEAGIGAILRPIDPSALDAADAWRGRLVGWPWRTMASDWRKSHASRFEVSVWHGVSLCGLALGKPAPSAPHISLHFMEGCPDPAHGLRGKVAACVLTALRAYGVMLGKSEIRLIEPLPEVIPYYCGPGLGFELVFERGGVPYCRRSI